MENPEDHLEDEATPEDEEARQIEALAKPKPITLSAIVRDILREHPNWNYDQINACLKLRTGKTVAKSTICRCRYSGLADRPRRTPKDRFTGTTGPRRGVDPRGIAEVMASCITVSDWQKITRKLVDFSINGDL